VAVDFTLPMLRMAPPLLHVAAADALKLPFNDDQFDAVACGFLVRNLAEVERGIDEQIRVLRPGGVLVILETTPRLLYTSDAADDPLCVDLGGRRIIKKKRFRPHRCRFLPFFSSPRSFCWYSFL